MKIKITNLFIALSFLSCGQSSDDSNANQSHPAIVGSWKLITGTVIEKNDTVVTDYTQNISFIKIINDTHFAFLQHDLKKGKDSGAVYGSGGGTYSLVDNVYTEHLEYCSDRNWEGNDFRFTVVVTNDTLIQKGVEKIESIGVDRINIEKYIRFKK